MAKYLKLYTKRLRRGRRLRRRFRSFFKLPRSVFIMRRKKKIKLQRVAHNYNRFLKKIRRRNHLKYIRRRISKKFTGYLSLRKIALRKYRKRYRKHRRRFKLITLDYLANQKLSKRSLLRQSSVLRLRLPRSIRSRWLSLPGLVNLSKRALRKSLLFQFFIIRSNSKYYLP